MRPCQRSITPSPVATWVRKHRGALWGARISVEGGDAGRDAAANICLDGPRQIGSTRRRRPRTARPCLSAPQSGGSLPDRLLKRAPNSLEMGGAVASPGSSSRPSSSIPAPLPARNEVRPAPTRLPTEGLTPSTIQAGPGLKWFLFAADDGPRRLWRFCLLCPCPSVAVKRMSALLSLPPGWPSGLPNAVMHVVMRNGPAARRNFDKMTRN